MRRTLLFFIFLLCVAATPVLGQEVFVRFGETRETGTSGSQTYAYGVSYFQGFGKNLAWSVGYLNERHVPNHKRGSLDFQSWARINVLNRRLSLGVGAVPTCTGVPPWGQRDPFTRMITAWGRSSTRQPTGTPTAALLSRERSIIS